MNHKSLISKLSREKIRKRFKAFLKPSTILITSIIIVASLLIGNYGLVHKNIENTFTIGTALAAGTPDYTTDGVADNVEFQAALNALPATGGRICILTGTYTFAATVSRAIDNVTIEGTGGGVDISFNGSDTIFDVGSQDGWKFSDLSVDAGSIDVSSATDYVLNGIWIDGQLTYTPMMADGAVTVATTGGSPNDCQVAADYLCDGVGGTDDTTTLGLALTAASAVGSSVYLYPGSYQLDTSWDGGGTWNGVDLVGSGSNGSHLGVEFDYDGGLDATDFALTLGSTTSNTRFSGASGFNVDCDNLIGGIQLLANYYSQYTDIYVQDVNDDATGLQFDGVGGVYASIDCAFRNVYISGHAVGTNKGLEAKSTINGITYEALHINSFQSGFYGYLTQGAKLTNSTIESCTYGMYLTKVVGGTIENLYTEGNTNSDIYLECSNASNGLTITGGDLASAGSYGIRIPATAQIDNIVLVGVKTRNHTTAGISIQTGGNVTSIVAINCDFSDGVDDPDGLLVQMNGAETILQNGNAAAYEINDADDEMLWRFGTVKDASGVVNTLSTPAATIASGASIYRRSLQIASGTTTLTGSVTVDDMKGMGLYINYATMADSSAVTVTRASTLYIVNSPQASGSVTITKSYAIDVAAGNVYFGGSLEVVGDILGIRDLVFNDATNLTISGGVITVTQSYHTVDEEVNGVADDLDTISGTQAGQVLTFRILDADAAITFKDGTGNLKLAGDFAMDTVDDTIMLLSDGSSLYELSRSNNA